MKQRNQFAQLPEEDRQRILELCSQHTYEQAVDILGQPRSEGGLEITTSPSSLCRLYTGNHPEPTRALLAQYATATYALHQRESNTFLGAIRASVECRVLENLKNGKSLVDMEKDFRSLKIVQKLFLDDAQWRTKNPEDATSAYSALIDRCSLIPEADFIRNDLPQDPGAEGVTLADFHYTSDFDLDVSAARTALQVQCSAHDDAILAHRQNSFSAPSAPLPSSVPAAAALPPQKSQTRPKTPDISQIPLNSTSPRNRDLPKTIPSLPNNPPQTDAEWKSVLDHPAPNIHPTTHQPSPAQFPSVKPASPSANLARQIPTPFADVQTAPHPPLSPSPGLSPSVRPQNPPVSLKTLPHCPGPQVEVCTKRYHPESCCVHQREL